MQLFQVVCTVVVGSHGTECANNLNENIFSTREEALRAMKNIKDDVFDCEVVAINVKTRFDIREMKIENTELSSRTIKALQEEGLTTVGDVLNCSLEELALSNWIGPKRLAEIDEIIFKELASEIT